MTRIYQDAALAEGMIVKLDERASHHIAHVLRAQSGEHLIIFNGQGGEYQAKIGVISKKAVEVEILTFNPTERESHLNIYLAQGIAKGEKMDWIIQKAVELGVKKIIPVITERCNVRLTGDREEKRVQHWRAVSISACEQSGRNRLPEIYAPMTLAECLTNIKADHSFVLTPHATQKLPQQKLTHHASIILLIGPEGGLSEQEITDAKSHHFLPLTLGPRVLRTETAGIAALAVLQYVYGDFD